MNERILELAELCYEKHELLGTYEFNKEKFAELIVRECATYAFSNEEDYYAMLKHFGVRND